MKESFVVNAELRTDQGKAASRRLRRTGKVPAVIYGGKDPAQQLALSHHEMAKHLETEAFYSHILTLKLDGKEQQAVLKDIQRHPAQPILMHFDFQRVFADVAIRMDVPLHFKGGEKCPGVKADGGLVEHTLTQVEVECLPKDLPEFIQVDLSELDTGHSLHVSALKLPDGVTVVSTGKVDPVVATAVVPKAIVETEETEAAAAVEGAVAAPVEGEAKPAETKAGDKDDKKKDAGKDDKKK